MGKCKHDCLAKEFDGDTGSIGVRALNEVSMARRNFLGQIGRLTGALAVCGLGAEAWMQTVTRRSIISSAVAGVAPRDMQLNPFPSDDTFNMPLGMSAWYASIGDPATEDMRTKSGGMAVNNGWSMPVYLATTSDPLQRFKDHSSRPGRAVHSYLPEEQGKTELLARCPSDAMPACWTCTGYADKHMNVVIGNDIIELFHADREDAKTIGARKVVRNRLDHYAHTGGSNPLRNVNGTRAWGGSGVAGLVRRHEVETSNPHIPHALIMGMRRTDQLGTSSVGGNDGPHGDPSSPLYNVRLMFPANSIDAHYYDGSTGSCRMGMRFAMDPTIVTDAFLNAISNAHTRAVVRALRDYGCIVGDTTASSNVLFGEQGIANSIQTSMQAWDQVGPDGVRMIRHMRRVAGAGPVDDPKETHWDSWRARGEGWGGGAPRVPYSPPLSGVSRPQSPGSIEVTESWRRFGDSA